VCKTGTPGDLARGVPRQIQSVGAQIQNEVEPKWLFGFITAPVGL
jgi:hypothetical protein